MNVGNTKLLFASLLLLTGHSVWGGSRVTHPDQ